MSRVHDRDELVAQLAHELPALSTAAWILAQLEEIAREVRVLPTWDDRYWKYHRLGRRYRALLRAWWQLPSPEAMRALSQAGELSEGRANDAWFTGGRARLAREVEQTQARQIQKGGTVYTFYPEAQYRGRSLFHEAPVEGSQP